MRVLDVDRVAILTEDIADSMERWNERLDLAFEHVNESEAGEPLETAYSHPGIEFLSPATDDGQLAERLDARGRASTPSSCGSPTSTRRRPSSPMTASSRSWRA